MTKPKREKKQTKKAADGSPPTTRAPNIEWVKNPDWTWALINYLTDHPIFRKKLFSDSTAEANKEGRKKAVAQDGRPQQYAVLAKHIFENDATQSALYAANPSRFVTSVETRLRRLKAEYSKYVKDIGATGAGLDPEEVTPGSELANLIATVTVDWPWWVEFHSFWKELPNYNPVAVESSTPGIDHAGEATALFNIPGGEEGDMFGDDGAELGADEGEKYDEGEDVIEEAGGEYKDHTTDPTLSSEPAPHQSLDPTPPLPAKVLSTPTSKAQPKVSKVKMILGGRDGGLAKANAAKSVTAPKNAIDRFNETRQQEAQRIDRKREREHEFRMEQERNKRLKYELKYGGKVKAAAEERASRREELLLQLEIARLNAQINQPLPTTPLATTPSATSTSFPLTPAPRPAFGEFNSPATFGEATGSSSSVLCKTGGSSSGKENMEEYDQVTSFSSSNDFFFSSYIPDN